MIKINSLALVVSILGFSVPAMADLSCHSVSIQDNNEWVITVQYQDENYSTVQINAELYENGRPSFVSTDFSGEVQTSSNGFAVVNADSSFSVSGIHGHITAKATTIGKPLNEDLICYAL